jgi:hypothetical protein
MTAEHVKHWPGTLATGPKPRYGLQIVVIYEDSLPQEWGMQVSRRAIHLVGPRSVHTVCWSVADLAGSAAMEAATEAAIAADILVITVSGAGALPPNVDRWIDSWLPCRLERAGALVAVIGVPQQSNAFPARIRDYLRDVASLAHLDFMPHERGLPLAHPGYWDAGIVKGAQTSPQVLSPLLDPSHTARSRAA